MGDYWCPVGGRCAQPGCWGDVHNRCEIHFCPLISAEVLGLIRKEIRKPHMSAVKNWRGRVTKLRNWLAWAAGDYKAVAPDSVDDDELCKMVEAAIRADRNRVAELVEFEKRSCDVEFRWQRRFDDMVSERNIARANLAKLEAKPGKVFSAATKMANVCVLKLSEMRGQVALLTAENRSLIRYRTANQKVVTAGAYSVPYAIQLEDSIKARVTERNNAQNEVRRLKREAVASQGRVTKLSDALNACGVLVGMRAGDDSSGVPGRVKDRVTELEVLEEALRGINLDQAHALKLSSDRVKELEAEVERLHDLVKYAMVVTTIIPESGMPRQHLHKGCGVYEPPLPAQPKKDD